MASGSLHTVLHYLRRLGPAEADARGDAQLLGRYTRHGAAAALAARARQRLQRGLSRRGVGLSAGLLAAVLAAHAAPAAPPARLAEAAAQSSLSFGRTGASAALTASAVALAQGALRSMFLTQLKVA